MPLIIDPSKEISPVRPGAKPDYINGVPLSLTQAQVQEVLYVKYENTNLFRSDVQHDQEWEEEFGADISSNAERPRIIVANGREQQRLRDDHGLIIRTYGTPAGTFCLTDTGMVSEEQAEALEEIQQKEFPRYRKWEFRVRRILKTDGPARRLRLQMANEQRKEDEKSEMFSAIKEAFEALSKNQLPAGALFPSMTPSIPSTPSTPSTSSDPFKGMEYEQILAIAELKKAEAESRQFQQQQVVLSQDSSRNLEELTDTPASSIKTQNAKEEEGNVPDVHQETVEDSLNKGTPLASSKQHSTLIRRK